MLFMIVRYFCPSCWIWHQHCIKCSQICVGKCSWFQTILWSGCIWRAWRVWNTSDTLVILLQTLYFSKWWYLVILSFCFLFCFQFLCSTYPFTVILVFLYCIFYITKISYVFFSSHWPHYDVPLCWVIIFSLDNVSPFVSFSLSLVLLSGSLHYSLLKSRRKRLVYESPFSISFCPVALLPLIT